MTENNTQECKDPQAEDTALSTSDSPLDVLSSIIKPQTRKEYVLPVLICIITLVHFLVFPQLDSFWINIIRLSLSVLTIIYIRNIAHKAYNKRLDIIKSFNNNQPQFFTTIVVFGGMLAIFIPMIMNITKLIDNSALLTTTLLTITGGIIAIFGYYITHQKSELEKEQMNMQKQKDARDHIRQVHAARRDRYIEAVDKLSSEQAPVRIGGVYALVGLVDEWLEDDNIDRETQLKEGQVIINNLCSYIRSPFPLALKAEMFESDSEPDNYEEDFVKDQAAFHEEQDVRRTIFVEMSKRSSKIIKKESKVIKTASGKWSDFDFDFSRAPIFYPLNAITIEQGNFSGAKVYIDTNFSETAFTRRATFIKAVFTRNADFSGAKFAYSASFSGAKFAYSASFSGATFTRRVNFSEARFTRRVNFSGATFTGIVDFTKTIFTHEANFSEATFNQRADFNRATFTRSANFSRATFIQHADFNRATFTRSVNFTKARFRNFKPTFATKLEHAQFSAGTSPQNYMFSVASGSKPINRKPATLLGKTFNIPLGTVLFDPDSPKNQHGNYIVHSDPAK